MTVILLTSSYGSNQVQVTQTRKLVDLFALKKVAFEQVDGVEDAETRNQLWEKSGKRGYPQLFVKGEYFGDVDKIQELLDNETFDEAFKDYIQA
eukprot:CAMPEP_0185184550 /NCGR_PEP_ID=MMETSP1140-20130426/2649_1 /TAXON_ID=298111 /ORGANISM="Pavlova sp., Strain CCMP459" /LENGTH=93 /DNA_ID=CAMNT_0027750629 /DNA_START=15 /DNA_END=296 /DNA_ORIENTATION=+